MTPCVETSTRPPGAVTRYSSDTALTGSSQCSRTWLQRTTSKLLSSTGSASTGPFSSARALSTWSTPTYVAAYGVNSGSYCFRPHPTSRTRYRPSAAWASADCWRRNSKSGLRTAYVGCDRGGSNCESTIGGGGGSGRREPEQETAGSRERDARDDSERRPLPGKREER